MNRKYEIIVVLYKLEGFYKMCAYNVDFIYKKQQPYHLQLLSAFEESIPKNSFLQQDLEFHDFDMSIDEIQNVFGFKYFVEVKAETKSKLYIDYTYKIADETHLDENIILNKK